MGCRGQGEKAELVRLVAVGGALVVDAAQRLPGRGAYLHPACAGLALRRRALPRALRAPGLAPAEAERALRALAGEASGVGAV